MTGSLLPGPPAAVCGSTGLVPVSANTSVHPAATDERFLSVTVPSPARLTFTASGSLTSVALRGSTVQPRCTCSLPEVAVTQPSNSGPLSAAPEPTGPTESNGQASSFEPSTVTRTVTFCVAPGCSVT